MRSVRFIPSVSVGARTSRCRGRRPAARHAVQRYRSRAGHGCDTDRYRYCMLRAELSTAQPPETLSGHTGQTGGRLRARSADFSYPGCSRGWREAHTGSAPKQAAQPSHAIGGTSADSWRGLSDRPLSSSAFRRQISARLIMMLPRSATTLQSEKVIGQSAGQV